MTFYNSHLKHLNAFSSLRTSKVSYGALTIRGTLSRPCGQLDHPLNLTALFGTLALCMRDVTRHYFIPQNDPLLFENRTSCCWTFLRRFHVFLHGFLYLDLLYATHMVQHVFRSNDQRWSASGPSHRNQCEKRRARNLNICAYCQQAQ